MDMNSLKELMKASVIFLVVSVFFIITIPLLLKLLLVVCDLLGLNLI